MDVLCGSGIIRFVMQTTNEIEFHDSQDLHSLRSSSYLSLHVNFGLFALDTNDRTELPPTSLPPPPITNPNHSLMICRKISDHAFQRDMVLLLLLLGGSGI